MDFIQVEDDGHYESNARGTITDQQRRALLARYDRSAVVAAGWLIFLLPALAGLTYLLPEIGIPIGGDEDTSPIAVVILVGTFLGSPTVAIIMMDILKRHYTQPRVERLMQHPIRQDSGSIEWHKGQLVGCVSDRRYPSVYGSKGEHQRLEAGRYTIHYIQNPDWMLSVQRLGMASATEHADALSRSIGRANGLVSEALAQNRQGRMSARQRKHLLLLLLRRFIALLVDLTPLLIVIGFATVVIVLLVLPSLADGSLAIPSLPSLADIREDGSRLLPFLLVIGIISLLIVAVLGVIRRMLHVIWMATLIVAGRNRRVTGELIRYHYQTHDDDGTIDHYYFIVGAVHFYVREEAYRITPDGRECTAYYLPLRDGTAMPNTQRLLNIDMR